MSTNRIRHAAERVRGVTEHLTAAERIEALTIILRTDVGSMGPILAPEFGVRVVDAMSAAVQRAAELPALLHQNGGRA